LEIARRARGTPRIGLKLLKRVRDFSQVRHASKISPAIVKQALDLHTIDAVGLDDHDRQLLVTIISKYAGGPVGLSTLAASLSEDPLTIEEVTEPYLLQLGFIQRTGQGRVATKLAYDHLHMQYPEK